MKYNSKIEKVALALLAMQRYSWEQGVAMQAFMELGKEEVLVLLAKEAAYRDLPDGRVAAIGVMESVTDACSTGEALKSAYGISGDADIKSAYDALLKWALEDAPRSKDGILYHVVEGREFWVDSFYMLPPFLAAAGHYEEALQQIDGYWECLYNPQAKLMSHIWDEETKNYKREAFWGVGNGWAIAGLARVIDLLPADMEDARQLLIERATTLIEATYAYIREDGLSHDVLDDETSFVETNFSQMLAYGIYRGVKSGWLNRKWLTAANKCREAVERKVDQYGLVQDVCGAPEFNSAGVAAEGQAFYLLMHAAYARLMLSSSLISQ